MAEPVLNSSPLSLDDVVNKTNVDDTIVNDKEEQDINIDNPIKFNNNEDNISNNQGNIVVGQSSSIVSLDDVVNKANQSVQLYEDFPWYQDVYNSFLANAEHMVEIPVGRTAEFFTQNPEWGVWVDEAVDETVQKRPYDPRSFESAIGQIGPSTMMASATILASRVAPQYAAVVQNSYAASMAFISFGYGLNGVKEYEKKAQQDLPMWQEGLIGTAYGIITFASEKLMAKGITALGTISDDVAEQQVRQSILTDIGEAYQNGERNKLVALLQTHLPELGEQMIKSGAIEGGTESVEQLFQNIVDEIYKPEYSEVLNGVAQAYGYGAISGGFLGVQNYGITTISNHIKLQNLADKYHNGDVAAMKSEILKYGNSSEIKLAENYSTAMDYLLEKIEEHKLFEKLNEEGTNEETLTNEVGEVIGKVTNVKDMKEVLLKQILDDTTIEKIRKDGGIEIDNEASFKGELSNSNINLGNTTKIVIDPNATDTQIENALAAAMYLKLKAPKFFSLTNSVNFWTHSQSGRKDGVRGWFNRGAPGDINIVLDNSITGETRGIGALVSTFAHEATHNRDFLKYGEAEYAKMFIIQNGPNKGADSRDPWVSWNDYRGVKGEDRAFRIGEVAQLAYEKLANLVAEQTGSQRGTPKGRQKIEITDDIIAAIDGLHKLYMEANIPTSEFLQDIIEIIPNRDLINPWLDTSIKEGNIIYDETILTDIFLTLSPNLSKEEVQSTVALITSWANSLSHQSGGHNTASEIIAFYFQSLKGVKTDNYHLHTTKFTEQGRALIEVSSEGDFETLIMELLPIFKASLHGSLKDAVDDWLVDNAAYTKGDPWTDLHHYRFAQAFMRFLRETGSNTQYELKEPFKVLRNQLREMFSRIKGSNIDVNLSDDIRAVFEIIVNRYDVTRKIEGYQDEINKGNIVMQKINNFLSALDIEHPFRQVGAEQVGTAIKRYWGTKGAYETEGLTVLKQIMTLFDMDMDKATDFLLLYERPRDFDIEMVSGNLNPATIKQYEAAKKILEEYFSKSLHQLKDANVLQEGYVDNLVTKLMEQVDEINETLKGDDKINDKDRAELKKHLEDLMIDLDEAQNNLSFVHIPVAYLFDKLLKKGEKPDFRRILTYLSKKKRKTFSLNDLVDEGIISRSQIDFADMLMSYARRKGSDLALASVINAAMESGLAIHSVSPNNIIPADVPAGYKRMSMYAGAGPFANHWLHPLLYEYVTELTSYSTQSEMLTKLDTFMTTSKLYQFINAGFLVTYNLFQMALAGALGPFVLTAGGIQQISKALGVSNKDSYILEGLRNFYLKNDAYMEAELHGVSSTPYPNPYEDAVEFFRAGGKKTVGFLPAEIKIGPITINNRQGGIVPHIFRLINNVLGGRANSKDIHSYSDYAGIPINWTKDIIDGVYNISFFFAWNMDQMQRHITYAKLKNEGYSPHEAGQMTAKFHGDYASVPSMTRRMLNRIFFTPTFKIIMGKLFGNILKGALLDGPRHLLHKITGIDNKWFSKKGTPTQLKYGKGAVRALAILQGLDMFMISLGFEREEWARKYVSKQRAEGEVFIGEDGTEYKSVRPDLVVTLSNPVNTFLRYIYRFQNTLNDPTSFNKWVDVVLDNKYDFHPVGQVFIEAASGKTLGGDTIFLESNTESFKLLQRGQHVITRLVKLTERFNEFDMVDENARKLFAEDMKKVPPVLSQLYQMTSYSYLRHEGSYIQARKLENLFNTMESDLKTFENMQKQYAMEGKIISMEMQLDILKRLDDINNELINLTFEYEPSAFFDYSQKAVDALFPKKWAESLTPYIQGGHDLGEKYMSQDRAKSTLPDTPKTNELPSEWFVK